MTLQPLRRFPARRRHPLQRHHDAAAGHGHCAHLRARAGGARADPQPRADRGAAGAACRQRDVPFVLESIRLVRAGAAARRAAHRLRRRAVHALVLSRVRPALEGICRGARVPLRAARGRRSAARRAWPMRWRRTSRRRPPPARRRSCCSSPGRGCSRRASSRAFALPAVRRTLAALRALGVPLIYYVNQGAALMPAVADLDVDVVGVDWRCTLAQVRARARARQGGAGQSRPGGAVCAARRSCGAMRDAVLDEAGRCARAHLQSRATASGRIPTPTPWRGSSTTCMSTADAGRS